MIKMRSALVIVDPQKDFCPGGSLAVTEALEIFPVINQMIREMPDAHIFVSRDWHPEETDHFKTWPVHCVRFTNGAEFHEDLKLPARPYTVITKGHFQNVDAYSVFDGVTSGGVSFKKVLESRQDINEIVVVGLATDYCVEATVLDLCDEGYNVVVPLNAVRGVNLHPGDVARAIDAMSEAGAKIVWSTVTRPTWCTCSDSRDCEGHRA